MDSWTRVFDGLLHVHYGQAYVVSGNADDTSDMNAMFRGQANGLLGAAQPGRLFLITGLHTGHVQFSVAISPAEPSLDDSWEECVEASFTPAGPPVRLVDWDWNLVCEIPLTGTHYRVRYYARGIDAGHQADTILKGEEPVDSYLLLFWPAALAPDRVVKQTSDGARYWHETARKL
jgi:hypothetical protein